MLCACAATVISPPSSGFSLVKFTEQKIADASEYFPLKTFQAFEVQTCHKQVFWRGFCKTGKFTSVGAASIPKRAGLDNIARIGFHCLMSRQNLSDLIATLNRNLSLRQPVLNISHLGENFTQTTCGLSIYSSWQASGGLHSCTTT